MSFNMVHPIYHRTKWMNHLAIIGKGCHAIFCCYVTSHAPQCNQYEHINYQCHTKSSTKCRLIHNLWRWFRGRIAKIKTLKYKKYQVFSTSTYIMSEANSWVFVLDHFFPSCDTQQVSLFDLYYNLDANRKASYLTMILIICIDNI